MKRLKRGTVIFFPGWPATPSLLGRYISYFEEKYEKVIIVLDKKSFSTKELKEIPKPITVIGYSAGVLKTKKLLSKLPEKSHVIMISPPGTRKKISSLIKHCFGFNLETIKLLLHGEAYIFWTVVREVLSRIFLHPVVSFREINEIRNFGLYAEMIAYNNNNKVKLSVIFSSGDRFLPPISESCYIGSEIDVVIVKSSGHFWFLAKPEIYQKAFEEL